MSQADVASPTPPPPIEPSSGRGCGWKIPGCLLGCALAIGVVILVVVAAAWWFLGPGTQHPTEAAVGSDSAGALQLRDLGADPGARQALEAVVQEARRRAAEENPAGTGAEEEGLSWLPTSDSRAAAAVIARALPREGTISFERVAGRDEPAAVLVLNLPGFTRPLRMMLEGDEEPRERYRGVAVTSAKEGDTFFAMVDGTLVIADERGAFHRAIDRLLDGTGEPPPASHLEILDRPPQGALLSGVFRPDEMRAMNRTDDGGAPDALGPFSGVRRLEVLVDGVDPRAVHLLVGVDAESSADTDRVAETLRERFAPANVTVTTQKRPAGTVLDLEITDWIGPFTGWLVDDDTDAEGSSAPPSARPTTR